MTILQKGLVSILTVAAVSTLYATQFEIMPTIGKKIGSKDATLDDSKILWGIRGTAYITPNIGVQVAGETSSANPTSGGGNTDIERGSLNVLYEMDEMRMLRMRPYALVGAGYEMTHGATVKTTNDDSQMFYNAGVGVKLGVTDRVNLVTEVKGMHKADNGKNEVIGTVGVGVKLGAINKPAPNCSTPQAMSLEEFARMCKTERPAAPVQITTPVQQVQPEPVVVTKPAPQETIEETPYITPVPTPVEQSGTIPNGYYVQLAALFKGNGDILTSRLERKKYPYVLHKTTRFGKEATLVLAGPYETRREAVVALRYLKRLSRGAFVKRFP